MVPAAVVAEPQRSEEAKLESPRPVTPDEKKQHDDQSVQQRGTASRAKQKRPRPHDTEEEGGEEIEPVAKVHRKSQPLPEDDEDDVTPKPRRKRHRGGDAPDEEQSDGRGRHEHKGVRWKRVYLGLLICVVAAAISFGTTLLSQVLFLVLSVRWLLTLARVTPWIGLATGVLALAGYVLCVFLPSRFRARQLAVAVVWAQALGTLASIGLGLYLGRQFDALIQTRIQHAAQGALSEVGDPLGLSGTPTGIKPVTIQRQKEIVAEMSEWLKLGSQMESFKSRPFLWQVLPELLIYPHLVILPFFLRAIAQNVKAEAIVNNCYYLLLMAAGVIVTQVITQVVVSAAMRGSAGYVSLVRPLTCVDALLGLGYGAFQLFLLIEIWSAVGVYLDRRRS
jgi:hypothetical protein